MEQIKFINRILNRISKDNIAYQAVLRQVPISFFSFKKGFLSGWSIFRSKEKSCYPIFLGVESTAKCNLKCDFCPRTKFFTRNTGDMDMKLYRRIIDEIDPVFITLAQFGEPLVHPKIGEMIKYAANGKRSIRITTNATLLDERRGRVLIESGLDHILISFDSYKKKNYEKIRRGANFEYVVSNIKKFIKLKTKLKAKNPIISFNVTLSKDNISEIRGMIDFFLKEFNIPPTFTLMYTYGEDKFKKKMVDEKGILSIKKGYEYAKKFNIPSLESNLKALYKKVKTNDFSYHRPCFWPYYTTTISWDGKVYPCCVYFDCQIVLGDLKKATFKEIWNGKKYMEFRRLLNQGRNNLKLCKTCSISDDTIYNIIYKFVKYIPFIKIFSKRKWKNRRFAEGVNKK